MLMFVIQHQPHRAATQLRRELVACLLAHGSTFSRVGASGKPGAVQLLVTMTEKAKIRKDRFQFWTMAHPTKNFSITFSFPDDHEVQIMPFVLSPELVISTKAAGY